MQTLHELTDVITLKLKENIKLKDLEYLLENYIGVDWQSFVQFNDNKYYKNNIFTNEFIDIFIISWNNNQQSGIHDHPENGCLLKILKGSLQEDVYIKNDNEYKFIKTNYLNESDISYKENKLCIHNILNGNNKTISLHIYSPSNYKTIYYN